MTVRGDLEAIIAGRDCWCWSCGDAEKRALSALDKLDQAPRELTFDGKEEHRLVPDPVAAATPPETNAGVKSCGCNHPAAECKCSVSCAYCWPAFQPSPPSGT